MWLNSPSLYEDLRHQATQMSWGSPLSGSGKELVWAVILRASSVSPKPYFGLVWAGGPAVLQIWVLVLLVSDRRKGDDPSNVNRGVWTSRALTGNTFPGWKCTEEFFYSHPSPLLLVVIVAPKQTSPYERMITSILIVYVRESAYPHRCKVTQHALFC